MKTVNYVLIASAILIGLLCVVYYVSPQSLTEQTAELIETNSATKDSQNTVDKPFSDTKVDQHGISQKTTEEKTVPAVPKHVVFEGVVKKVYEDGKDGKLPQSYDVSVEKMLIGTISGVVRLDFTPPPEHLSFYLVARRYYKIDATYDSSSESYISSTVGPIFFPGTQE